MDNPWARLPEAPPYVLPEDAEAIDRFNATAEPIHLLHTEIRPEPFIGRPNASVIILTLNPGFSGDEIQWHDTDDKFKTAAMKNLSHSDQEYPFYFLNPDPQIQSPGHLWWRQRLGPLLKLYDASMLAREVFCVEYFPYHSTGFRQDTPRVPSQGYAFHLVREAVQRKAVIIALRAVQRWIEAVPELRENPFFRLNSNQNVVISKNNAGAGFDAILNALGPATI